MRKIASLMLSVLLPFIVNADPTSMALSDAIKKEVVTLDAVNKGTYLGKSTTLTITNNSNDEVEIKIDAGTMLKPGNPAFQPLVIAADETVKIKSHDKASIAVETFCGVALKACPLNELHYSYLGEADKKMIKVLEFIKENNLFDHLGQAAVWTITDHHSLNNVYDNKRDALSIKLIDMLVHVTKQDKPKFYTPRMMNETPAQPAYLTKVEKIYVPFDITLSASKVLTAGLFTAKGQLVKTLIDHKAYEPGEHNLMMELQAANFDPDKYKVRLMEADKTLQETEITITE